MQLPKTYLKTMKELLGADFNAYLDSFNDSRLYGLRINTLKISPQEFLKISPFDLKPIPWIENGFYFSEKDKPAKHPYYFAGLYYIQEPSAMTPANVLPVAPGDLVFDMCAAPGGKSTELGAKLAQTGLLVTNDISNSRAKALLKNIEVCGIPNVFVLSEDPKKIAGRFAGFFDKVLIDAPCSGEGMFRKDHKLIRSWEKNGPAYYAKIQRELVLLGADLLKPGGKLLYSTCTFSKAEDEDTVRHLLHCRPMMRLAEIAPYEGFSPGVSGPGEDRALQLEKCVRIFPHRMAGEGHFLALFEKSDQAAGTDLAPHKPYSEKLPQELQAFFSDVTYPIPPEELVIRDAKVYVSVREMPDEKGLRILRGGLLLGELKKNRFEPSQAFAMALKSTQYRHVISLPAADDRVVRYLKGETIDLPEFSDHVQSGWNLFCVDGFPLGWGKYNGMSLKNKYLPGWRWV